MHVLGRVGRTYGWPSWRGEIEIEADFRHGARIERFLGICYFLTAYENKRGESSHAVCSLLWFFAVSSVAAMYDN